MNVISDRQNHYGTISRRAARGEQLRGVLVRMPSVAGILAAGRAGLDFVVLDLDSGPADERDLQHHLLAAQAAEIDVLAMVSQPDQAPRLFRLGIAGVVTADAGTVRWADQNLEASGIRLSIGSRHQPAESVALHALDLDAEVETVLKTFAAARELPAGHAQSGRDTLIVLPGMLGDVSVWDEVAAALPSDQPCAALRIDLDSSISEMAATVLAAAPARFALAGHSLGAIVALEVMRQAPERVSRLALLNSSARGPSQAQLAAWDSQLARIDDGDFAGVADELARVTVLPDRADTPALIKKSLAMAARVGPGGLRRQLMAQRTRPDSLPTLARIAVPTLVVTGSLDGVSKPELQQEMSDGIPGADHRVIDGAGHMSILDHPNAVGSLLTEWLQR